MTFTQAKQDLSKLGVTLRKIDGEFRVTLKGAGEAGAYYTGDLSDAVATGKRIAAPHATVTREIAEAFGMTNLPNVTVVDEPESTQREETLKYLQRAVEHAPVNVQHAADLAAWITADGLTICAYHAARILARGCSLPNGVRPVYTDQPQPSEHCCLCPTPKPKPPTPDFTLQNHGTIALLVPNTPEAKSHLESVVVGETIWFANALAVEPRYVSDLAEHLQSNGFTVAE
jgi:hypothetical protein